jgi:broad specificity phosphatase PhoE
MSSLRLQLVRHGQTPANVRRALDSLPPGPPLTDEGRRQAAAFAESIATEPVAAVYASTAIRAQETAQPTARMHGLEVQVIEGVHEVFCGDLEGRTDQDAYVQFVSVYDRWTTGDLDARIPGGENGHEIRERYLAAIAGIRERHADGLVVLVSHGGVIRLGAEWLTDNVSAHLANVGVLPNTGQVQLEAKGDGWHCLDWTGLDLPS